MEAAEYINKHVKNATCFIQQMDETDKEENPVPLKGTSKQHEFRCFFFIFASKLQIAYIQ